MSRLDEIRARADAATPGPWLLHKNGGELEIVDASGATSDASDIAFMHVHAEKEDWALPGTGYDNAEFIAHAREDIPYLLSEIERLTREKEEGK